MQAQGICGGGAARLGLTPLSRSRTKPRRRVQLHAYHIVPRAAGGSDDLSNLTTACTGCNQGKGSN